MNSRKLIIHTRNCLIEHEYNHLGIPIGNKLINQHERDLTNPIAESEEVIITNYLKKHEITVKNDANFIKEMYFGCIRHRAFLEATLKLFYKLNKGKFLQKEFYLFSIITYMGLWRLEELGFATFSRFVHCFHPEHMASLISFLFNPSLIQKELKNLWCTILDSSFVKEHIIDQLLHHVSMADQLKEELVTLTEKGMVVQKSDRPPIETNPFLLTEVKPRKLPNPEYVIPVVIKAQEISKHVFKQPAELKELKRLQKINKEKSMKVYEEAQSKQFNAAKPKNKEKIEQLRQKIKLEEMKSIQKIKRNSQKSLQKMSNMKVDVKLNVGAILREQALIKKEKESQQNSLLEAEMGIRDIEEFHRWKDEIRSKDDEAKLIEMEKKRLEIQLLHEEAYLSRQRKILENKEKAAEVMATQEEIKEQAEEWKQEQIKYQKKIIESVQQSKEGIAKAKEALAKEKSKQASKVSKEKKALQEQMQKEAEKERARKVELIQQIRLLEKKGPALHKEIDLTESSGFGLLGEMSVIELQERLSHIKLREKALQENKRIEIANSKLKRAQEINAMMQNIDIVRQNRRQQRTHKALPDRGLSVASVQSDRSNNDIKGILLDADPQLKKLQEKIMLKKSLRLANKPVVKTRINSSNPATPTKQPEMDEIDRAKCDFLTYKQDTTAIGTEASPV
ncbi:hypothetical protein BC833DRAFT_590480, partial [Globomyces pollinis-pini]